MATGDDGGPGSPWVIQATRMAQNTGWPPERCYDLTIADWLWRGDVRALAARLLGGHAPGPYTLKVLSWLLLDDPDFKIQRRGTLHPVPYRLVVKDRRGRRGRRNNPENDVRDMLLAENMARLIPVLGYEKCAGADERGSS